MMTSVRLQVHGAGWPVRVLLSHDGTIVNAWSIILSRSSNCVSFILHRG